MEEQITIQFTSEEIKMLLEIINAVSFQGNSVEQIFNLKSKIKSASEAERKEK